MQYLWPVLSLLAISLSTASASQAVQAAPAQTGIDHGSSAPFFDPKLFHPPVPTKTPEAEIPEQARQRNLGGRCALSLVIDAHGEPQNVQLIRCTHPVFSTNALQAVKSYRFKPAISIPDNKAVPVTMSIEIIFATGMPGDQGLPPARVRTDFTVPSLPVVPAPDDKGIYTLSPNFGSPDLYPRLKKFADRHFANTAFHFDDGVGCTIALIIDQSGKPSDLKVARCDRVGLEKSAIESLSKAQFTPAILNGKAVSVHAVVRLVCEGFDIPYRQP